MIKNYFNGLKKILFTCSFITVLSHFSVAQVVNSNTEDIIIQIEHFNFEKQLNDISQQLYNYKGVQIAGYCRSLDVLMFRVDRNIQTDDTRMFETLKNAGYLFQLKENASIEKVEAACRDKKENMNTHQE